MLRRALKMCFWVCHDHLGKLVLLNVLLTAALALPVLLLGGAIATGDPEVLLVAGLPLLLALAGVLLPVALVGMSALSKDILETRECRLGAFQEGVRRHGMRAAGVGIGFLLAGLCLAGSGWFYVLRLGAWAPWAGFLASSLVLWVLCVLLLGGLLAMPALVHRRQSAWATARLALLLVLANPGFAVGLGLCMAVLFVLVAVPPMGLLFSVAPAGVLLAAGYEILARRYAALAQRAAAGKRAGGEDIDFGDSADDFLNRGVRDFLFPWRLQ